MNSRPRSKRRAMTLGLSVLAAAGLAADTASANSPAGSPGQGGVDAGAYREAATPPAKRHRISAGHASRRRR